MITFLLSNISDKIRKERILSLLGQINLKDLKDVEYIDFIV
jgi:hypothetical protein